jgi:hypothetical protein
VLPRPACVSLNFDGLDQRSGRAKFDFMGQLHRTINLAIPLVLVALGGVGIVYFYFITATLNGWMALAAAVVGAAGLYWLWDEHINAGRPES